jgi:hypothetical protein
MFYSIIIVFCLGIDEGEKVTESGREEKMEVDEAVTGSDQPVAAMNTDDSAPTEETFQDNSEHTELLPEDSLHAEEISPDDNAPTEETSRDDSAPAEETLLEDRTSPVETEENSQASEVEDSRPSSPQPVVSADSRLSPQLESEVRIPSPVAGSENKSLHPPGDIEESVASSPCNENELSAEIRDAGELCQEGEQVGEREIRSSPTSETETTDPEGTASISPVNNEVPSLSGDMLADTLIESTDTSVAGNIVPLLQENAEPLLPEDNKGETEEILASAAE